MEEQMEKIVEFVAQQIKELSTLKDESQIQLHATSIVNEVAAETATEIAAESATEAAAEAAAATPKK
jgi:hypothetical protein